MALNLPNPPNNYIIDWMNQYTQALENENLLLWAAIQTLQLLDLPNYTTTQKNTLPNKAGRMVFDTTLGKACINNGATWETITSV